MESRIDLKHTSVMSKDICKNQTSWIDIFWNGALHSHFLFDPDAHDR